jgi:hypothetical protein
LLPTRHRQDDQRESVGCHDLSYDPHTFFCAGQNAMKHHSHFLFTRSLPLYIASLFLVACGGGSGGTEGSGQAPDPVTVDLPIAYIERPLPADEDDPELLLAKDILDPAAFNPGAAIYLKPRATAIAAAENITQDAFIDDENFIPETPNYDVKDLSIHSDGDRLLFAMRAPEIPNADEEDQPTWDIWEYHLTTKVLRRIITSDIVAAAGHDLNPAYLPDDSIVFSSTRQTRSRAMLLDDNKPQYTAQEEGNDGPAFVLHVMDNDGTNIQQITYNQSHDLQPTVLDNGRVLFTRWDQAGSNNLSLYTVNPDGTDVQYHYGFNSLNTTPRDEALTLFRPQAMPDNRVASIFKRRSEFLGGDMVVIDTENFVENELAINGGSGEAQAPLYHLEIVTDNERSRNGVFSSLHPLFDGTNRLLVSWSQCRMQVIATGRLVPCTDEWWDNEETEIAPPLFGIWIYNLTDSTQQPVVLGKEGLMFTEAVTLEPRVAAAYIAPTTDNSSLGTLHIRSVYDGNLAGIDPDDFTLGAVANPAITPTADRPARFVRIVKAVSIADGDVLDEQDDNVYGNRFNQNNNMREIIGYTPVEPDGSVLVQVPADIAFTLQVLDADGRRFSTNTTYWMQLRPGERRECNDCLSTTATQPVSRADIQFDSINSGAAGGASFPGPARYQNIGVGEFPEYVLALPESGETMAEFAARTFFAVPAVQEGEPDNYTTEGLRQPTVDLIFTDEWTDVALASRAAPFAQRYADLIPGEPEESITKAPLKNKGCLSEWNSTCRTVINYENHIYYLWGRERMMPIDPDADVVIFEDRRCTACHNRADESVDPAVAQIPAGQLELTNAPSTDNQMTSYRELLFDDVELELVEGGSLTPRIIETGECNVDENGEEIRDEDGICLSPVVETVPVDASMSTAGARASGRFFNRFVDHDPVTETADHRGLLNPSEMKLLREWLDLGGRYYQNPFDSADPIQD